jgi:hypothetical protein
LLHGRHPLYPVILGVQDGLIPTEASEGPVAENRAPSNTPSALLRPLSNSEVFVIENIPIGGPSEGLLETKYGAGKLASVTTDLVVHELTGRLEADRRRRSRRLAGSAVLSAAQSARLFRFEDSRFRRCSFRRYQAFRLQESIPFSVALMLLQALERPS